MLKQNYYKSGRKLAKQDRKQGEAFDRQRAHNSLGTEQKISKIKSRRGNSAKELKKLLAPNQNKV
jgi:hypothetical protein